MSKDAFWFQHDSNARHDPRLVRLRMKHGLAGVGFFWCCIEFLRDQDEYQATRDEFEALEFEMGESDGVFATMIHVGLLETEDDVYFSQSLKNRMFEWDERKRKLSEAGKRGGRPAKAIKKGGLKQVEPTGKPGESYNITVQESTGDDITRENMITESPIPPKGADKRFESFWNAYDHKIGKGAAVRAFKKAIKAGLPEPDTLVAIIGVQKAQRAKLKASGVFVPEWPNPTTWLNGERWTDEIKAPEREQQLSTLREM